MDLMCACSNLE